MNVLLFFVDGVGAGPADPDRNPFAAFALPAFERLCRGTLDDNMHVVEPRRLAITIDATLGVAGLPQSGTGQATLFTGVNCAQVVGHHFGPFPPSKTLPVIAEHNVFKQAAAIPEIGIDRVAFANAYPKQFFQFAERRKRWTVTTRCCTDAGVRIRTLDDLLEENAVAADITGEGLVHFEPQLRPATEDEAAARLATILLQNRLTCFEYFKTDKAGHAQSFRQAQSVLASVDRFLGALTERLADEAVTLVVTSDHGNLEDLSTRSHTLNRVPLLVVGEGASRLADCASIADITPAIVDILESDS